MPLHITGEGHSLQVGWPIITTVQKALHFEKNRFSGRRISLDVANFQRVTIFFFHIIFSLLPIRYELAEIYVPSLPVLQSSPPNLIWSRPKAPFLRILFVDTRTANTSPEAKSTNPHPHHQHHHHHHQTTTYRACIINHQRIISTNH